MPKYPVPTTVRNIARNAIKENQALPISQRAAYKDEGGKRVEGTGMRTARRLVSGAIDEEQIRLMDAWFARHGASEMETQKRRDKTSKASRAWRLWGGNAGRSFVSQMVRKLDKKKRQEE